MEVSRPCKASAGTRHFAKYFRILHHYAADLVACCKGFATGNGEFPRVIRVAGFRLKEKGLKPFFGLPFDHLSRWHCLHPARWSNETTKH
jgi:hypothetical protein